MSTITARSIRRWQEANGKRDPIKCEPVEKRTEIIREGRRRWCHPTKGWRNERAPS